MVAVVDWRKPPKDHRTTMCSWIVPAIVAWDRCEIWCVRVLVLFFHPYLHLYLVCLYLDSLLAFLWTTIWYVRGHWGADVVRALAHPIVVALLGVCRVTILGWLLLFCYPLVVSVVGDAFARGYLLPNGTNRNRPSLRLTNSPWRRDSVPNHPGRRHSLYCDYSNAIGTWPIRP